MESIAEVNENQMIGASLSRKDKDKLKEYFQSGIKYVSSDEFEQKLDNGIDFAKGTVAVLGTTATIILTICPFDGPVGEILVGLATPGLVTAVDALGEEIKKIYKDGKKIYSGSVNSNTGKVELGKAISNETLTTVEDIKTFAGNVKNNASEINRIFNDKKSTEISIYQDNMVK